MSDLAASWIAAAPSAWRSRLHAFSVGVSAGVVVALILIHATGSEAIALGVAAAGSVVAAGASVWLVRRRARRPAPPAAWRVAPDGRIAIRTEAGAEHTAAVHFVSAFLIVLRGGGASLEIWRDATPFPAFRRLSVASRWTAERHRGAALITVNRADEPPRT